MYSAQQEPGVRFCWFGVDMWLGYGVNRLPAAGRHSLSMELQLRQWPPGAQAAVFGCKLDKATVGFALLEHNTGLG